MWPTHTHTNTHTCTYTCTHILVLTRLGAVAFGSVCGVSLVTSLSSLRCSSESRCVLFLQTTCIRTYTYIRIRERPLVHVLLLVLVLVFELLCNVALHLGATVSAAHGSAWGWAVTLPRVWQVPRLCGVSFSAGAMVSAARRQRLRFAWE